MNARIDESFVRTGEAESPLPRTDWTRWKADRLAELRSLSFRTFPDRIPAARARGSEADAGQAPRWLDDRAGHRGGDRRSSPVPEAEPRRGDTDRAQRRRKLGRRAGLGQVDRGRAMPW